MTRSQYTLLSALLFGVARAHAAGLPDTGQTTCYDDAAADGVAASDPASIARDAGTHPRQDCRYGRDVAAAAGALTKVGGGVSGFDYSKIANDGTVLAATAAQGSNPGDWGCTRDNVTGLTWEIKTADSADLHYYQHSYTWYSSDAATNGGDAGSTGSNSCNGTLPSGQCNTEAFVTAVNAAALCGYTDWRMPTKRELLTLSVLGGASPNIDPSYFPYTVGSPYWSGSPYAPNSANAWNVGFDGGSTNYDAKTTQRYVRVVRGATF